MAVHFFLAFFVLSHLVLLHSVSAQKDNIIQISCPKSFDCTNFGRLKFPFANSTLYSQCGLCTVTCDELVPQILLGNERSRYDESHLDCYEVKEMISQDDKIQVQIHDTRIKSCLDGRNCSVFSNLTFPNSPSISFTISQNLTFFKCNESSELSSHKHVSFDGFHNYTICDGQYSLYYKYPDDQNSAPSDHDLPINCSVIQLPVKSSNMQPNAYDPFELLVADYILELHVSEDCLNCHQRGGQCQNDNQTFHCTAEEGGQCQNDNQTFPCTNKEGSTRISKIKLVSGIAATGMLITIILFCYFSRKCLSSKFPKFGKLVTKDNQNFEAFLKNFGSLAPRRYSYSEVKKITNSFKDRLGQGGFGSVYKGKLPNGHLVAVKVLKESKGNGEEFVNEVASISRTSHVNIVTLLGFCFEGHKRALIYEFMPNGSLEKFIYERSSSTERQLGWETLYKVAVGIARGLEYLHLGCRTRILHFDIKPHNILLDEDFCPKISDFGLAKLCLKKESIISMSGTRGTAGYIAPEVFCRNCVGVSYKSDVYSYGMMILEMVGGRRNIDVGVDHTSEIYFPDWIYSHLEPDEEIGLHGITNEEENERSRKMIIVGLWCIQTDPSNRPSMSRVVEMLEGSLESLQIPPKPFLSSPPRAPADSTTT